MKKEPVFSIKGLTKVYRMGEVEVHALRGIDLDLWSGELVVFLGPSGSGKSTLLNIMGGLDTPTEGMVTYKGRDLTRAKEAELTDYRRHSVGFVFQFYNLIPSLTARENVAVVTEIAAKPMKPEDALFVVEGGRAIERIVKIGRRNGLAAQVLSGLSEGEEVVTHPDDSIRDNSRIRVAGK